LRKKRFYWILTLLTVLGYFWLAFHFVKQETTGVTLCVFKRLTTLPCPACGSSRSVLLITEGNYYEALVMNPLGYFLTIGLLVLPFWLMYDFVNKQDSLFTASERLNKLFKHSLWPMFFTTLVILNWIWNIHKGL